MSSVEAVTLWLSCPDQNLLSQTRTFPTAVSWKRDDNRGNTECVTARWEFASSALVFCRKSCSSGRSNDVAKHVCMWQEMPLCLLGWLYLIRRHPEKTAELKLWFPPLHLFVCLFFMFLFCPEKLFACYFLWKIMRRRNAITHSCSRPSPCAPHSDCQAAFRQLDIFTVFNVLLAESLFPSSSTPPQISISQNPTGIFRFTIVLL